MVESFKEWVELLVRDGMLCDAYQEKLRNAHSKASIMDICLDANGISYLCEMSQKGYGLPYDVIKREFGNYFNGRYVSRRFKNDRICYSGSIFCDDDSDVTIDTTCTAFLGCVKNVYVQDNDFVRICVDKKSILTVYCPYTSKCIVECYGGASIVDANKFNNIKIEYK